jgi:hypothetical protein
MIEPDNEGDWDEAPFVCPGCYAVGEEECAADCVDAAIEAERTERSDHDRFYEDDDEEPVPESQRTPPLQEAAAELALCQRRLERSVHRLVDALTPVERQGLVLVDARGPSRGPSPAELVFEPPPDSLPRLERPRIVDRNPGGRLARERALRVAWFDAQPIAEGGYSCRWCRELVETEQDERDHDFCEPRGPYVPVPADYFEQIDREHPSAAEEWRDELCCPACRSCHRVTLRRERFELTGSLRALGATTVQCSCGYNIYICYSWERMCLVKTQAYRRGQPLSLVR